MVLHSRLHPVIARALESATGAAPYHSLPVEEARATAKKAYRRTGEPVSVGRVQNLLDYSLNSRENQG